jgi:hypothetical protein
MAALQASGKYTAHPAVGGTALSRSACALPLNLIWDFETTSKPFCFQVLIRLNASF